MMKSAIISIFLVFLVFSLCLSCGKEKPLPENRLATQLDFKAEGKIRDIFSLTNGDIILCGGVRNASGFIYRSEDNGNSWQKEFHSEKYSINALDGIDTKVVACADSLHLFGFENDSGAWQAFDMPCYPWEAYINSYHDVEVISSGYMIAAGGAYYQRGILSFPAHLDYSAWVHISSDNEWRSISFEDSLHGYMAGYGRVLYTDDGGNTWEGTGITGDFFVKILFNQEQYYVLGRDGHMYRGKNTDWELIACLTGRFHDMVVGENYIYAVGDAGRCYFADKTLLEWEKADVLTGKNLSCISAFNKDFFVGTSTGELYRLSE